MNKKEWGGFCPGGILSGYRGDMTGHTFPFHGHVIVMHIFIYYILNGFGYKLCYNVSSQTN